MEDLIYALAMSVGIPLAIWLVFRGASAPPPVEGDALVLRYPRGVEVAGWGIAALGAAMVGVVDGDLARDHVGGGRCGVGRPGALRGRSGSPVLSRLPTRVGPGDGSGRRGANGLPPGADARCVGGGRAGDGSRSLSGYLSLWGPDGRRVAVSAFHRGADRLAETVGRRLAVPGAAEAVREFMTYRAGYGIR